MKMYLKHQDYWFCIYYYKAKYWEMCILPLWYSPLDPRLLLEEIEESL